MPGPEVRTHDPEASEPPLEVGSRLCTQCGLCCTGALHNYAVLEPGEIPFARTLGLTLRTEGKPGFALPCPRLVGSKCSIYLDRPNVCGRYKCQLLESVEAGATAFESAIDRVAIAKGLAAKVAAAMPAGMTLPEARQRFKTDPSMETSPPERVEDMPLKLAITALSVYLDKYFRHSKEGKMMSLEPIEPQDRESK
jgi:uncharacterized protein